MITSSTILLLVRFVRRASGIVVIGFRGVAGKDYYTGLCPVHESEGSPYKPV